MEEGKTIKLVLNEKLRWKGEATEESSASDLRLSSKKIGKLYPVLLDRDGNIIDGQHRLAADANWPSMRLSHIGSEKERLLARLISNVCRRTVSAEEKQQALEDLGRVYLKEGEKPGRLAYRIAEDTGMTYRWVMKYLPEQMKSRPGLGGPPKLDRLDKSKEEIDMCKVERRSTSLLANLLSGNQERVVVVRTYVNASFVNLTIEKKFYESFEKLADKLNIAPQTLINNAMLMVLKEIENIARQEIDTDRLNARPIEHVSA